MQLIAGSRLSRWNLASGLEKAVASSRKKVRIFVYLYLMFLWVVQLLDSYFPEG